MTANILAYRDRDPVPDEPAPLEDDNVSGQIGAVPLPTWGPDPETTAERDERLRGFRSSTA